MTTKPSRCAVDGCTNTGTITRGYCQSHYQRWRRYGDAGDADLPSVVEVDGIRMRVTYAQSLNSEADNAVWHVVDLTTFIRDEPLCRRAMIGSLGVRAVPGGGRVCSRCRTVLRSRSCVSTMVETTRTEEQ